MRELMFLSLGMFVGIYILSCVISWAQTKPLRIGIAKAIERIDKSIHYPHHFTCIMIDDYAGGFWKKEYEKFLERKEILKPNYRTINAGRLEWPNEQVNKLRIELLNEFKKENTKWWAV